MTTVLSWIILSHRYRYAVDNTSIAFLTGIVGGFLFACLLIWLVFHHGVEESRLRYWLSGCAAAGLAAGVVIYRLMLPHGLCWTWFGCSAAVGSRRRMTAPAWRNQAVAKGVMIHEGRSSSEKESACSLSNTHVVRREWRGVGPCAPGIWQRRNRDDVAGWLLRHGPPPSRTV